MCVVCFMSSLFLCLAHQTLYSHVLFPLPVLALPLPSGWLLRLSGCICVNENWNNNILQNVSLRRPPPPLAPPPFLCCVCFLSTRFFFVVNTRRNGFQNRETSHRASPCCASRLRRVANGGRLVAFCICLPSVCCVFSPRTISGLDDR